MCFSEKIVKKVLLLNPPGKKRYNRDYYCSSISKCAYYWHPIDFIVLSGLLKDYNLYLIDSIAEKKYRTETLSEIEKISPDVIIFLTSSLSFKEDIEFIKDLKKTDATLIGCGDVFLDKSTEVWKYIDGAILDFTNSNVADFIQNPVKYNRLLPYEKSPNGYFEYPVPLHEKFLHIKYIYPHLWSYPFASVLTNYGCPYKCHFCNSGQLGFKLRSISNILDELKYVVHNLKIRQVFFKDMTFAAVKSHTKELLEFIIKLDLKIKFNCYSRTDLIDEELALLMRNAGCYLIQFGIETINPDVLKKVRKNFSISEAEEVIKILKRNKILVGLHFICGLPGDTIDSIDKSVEFAKKVNADYISLNIFSPRPGSILNNYSDQERINIFKKYQKYGNIKFYLRPKYLLQKVLNLHSFYELRNLISMGSSLLWNIIKEK